MKTFKIVISFIGLSFFIYLSIINSYVFATTYSVSNNTIDTGGSNNQSSTSYNLGSSIGQINQGVSSSANYTIKTGYQYYDYGFSAPYITMTIPVTTESFGQLSPTTFYTVSYNVNVTTNADYGYGLYISENNDMQNSSDPSITIPGFDSGAITSAVSWTSPSTTGLGYNVSGTDADSDFSSSSMFRELSSSQSVHIAGTTGPTETTGGDQLTMTFKVSIPQTQGAGDYQNNCIYTAIANY